jgi:hypothetical protein
MSVKNGQDSTGADPRGPEEQQDYERGGMGAATALERMKAEHALRHRHHGTRGAGPGHEDDRAPER